MLYFLLNWIYTSIICYLFGDALIDWLKRVFQVSASKVPHPTLLIVSGLVAITFLANLSSIFIRINIEFFFGILLCGLVQAIFKWQVYRERLKTLANSISDTHWLVMIFGFAFFLMAIFQASNIGDNLDEGAYYLPLVRWIENYPVVPGTAWFIDRMAYNSAYHMSNAVFGQAWLVKPGLYDLTASLFIWMNFYFLGGLNRLLRSKTDSSYSDWIMVIAMVIPFSFLNDSMDSDYPNIFIGFLIVTLWLDKIQRKAFWEIDTTFLLILSFGFYLSTIRLFSVLFLAFPAVLLIKQLGLGKNKAFIICFGLGLLYAAPWLIRNYYISGYLVYPFYFVDWFNPDWKLPLDLAKNNYTYIGTYAKNSLLPINYQYEGLIVQSFPGWLPGWVDVMKRSLLDLLVLIALPVSTILYAVLWFRKGDIHFRRLRWTLLFMMGVILLWFFNFPSVRFAWTWILSFMALSLLPICLDYLRLPRFILVYGFTVLIGLMLVRNVIREFNYFEPSTDRIIEGLHNKTEPHSIEKIGIIELKVVEGENCWGLEPPCQPALNPYKVQMRGQSIEDGFKQKD